jgi:3-phenylpropionate/trans-cinnamate dioxygenase ferredoxin component
MPLPMSRADSGIAIVVADELRQHRGQCRVSYACFNMEYPPMSGYVKVASRGDIAEGQMIAVQTDGAEIMLACVGGELFALDVLCSHADGYLDQGWIDGNTVVCPLHAGSFDLRTGAPVAPPCDTPVRSYPVKIAGDDILVDLSPATS